MREGKSIDTEIQNKAWRWRWRWSSKVIPFHLIAYFDRTLV
jgi:hypothetical protein